MTKANRSTSEDARTRKNSAPEARGSRASQDDERTLNDGTAFTADERRAMIRSEFSQEALPSVPKMPGWHLCWLSTTNSYDPVHKRMRMGYLPVKASDCKGYENLSMTSGEFAGCISCNEMVLFKLPEEIYQEIMAEFHHNMPLEEEEALKRALLPNGGTDADSTGKPIGQILEESDYDSLGKVPKTAPRFA
jgi:hypothetical protein